MRSAHPLRLCVATGLVAALAACASLRGAQLPASDASSRRSLPAGDVVGFTGPYGSHVWRGLPYAAAPVGELRWRAPRPAPRWEGVREALATGSACPQFASVFSGEGRAAAGMIGDEDCLYLDVYAPRLSPGELPKAGERLPVMVWIHGGGNSIGRAGFYDGGNLAATHRVVVVAINYRLGPFGWFRHASLRGDGTSAEERSGNFATLDHLRALEWVQENVAAFGGDPGSVTIFGESAGGRNVLSLLLAPGAQGLFHRAIIQSGGMNSSSLAEAEHFADDPERGDPHSSNEILARLLVADGQAPTREAAKARITALAPAQVSAFLLGRSTAQILAAYVGDPYSYQGMLELPQVFRDGTLLPAEEPMASLARGAYQRVPVLLGTNRDENKLFMVMNPELTRWLFGLFPRARDADRYDAQAQHQANVWKAGSVDAPAAAMRAVQGPSVYGYRWDWDEEPGLPLLYDGSRMIGAAHGLEIPFVFGHWDLGPDTGMLFGRGSREDREALSAAMMSYWAEFAYSGAPGRGRRGELPEWTAWDASSPVAPRYLVLDTPAGGGLRLASRTYTVEGVIADLLADPRFATARDRCTVLRNLTEMAFASRAQYDSTSACAALAYDAWPWPDVAAAQ